MHTYGVLDVSNEMPFRDYMHIPQKQEVGRDPNGHWLQQCVVLCVHHLALSCSHGLGNES